MRRACFVVLLAACAPMQVGEPCTAHHCVEGAECAEVTPGVDRCVALCTAPLDLCAGGEVCYPTGYADGSLGCAPGGDTAVGAACTYATECVRGSYCAIGADGMTGICVRACAGGAGGCGLTWDACPRGDTDCASGFCVCAVGDCTAGAIGVCTEECTLAPGRTFGRCANGAACAAYENGRDACVPAGTVAVGVACAPSDACVLGAICVSEGGVSTCRRVCDVDAHCPPPLTCTGGIC